MESKADRLIVEYEEFPEDNIKVLSVVREENDEVISMAQGRLAEFLYDILRGEKVVSFTKTSGIIYEEV